MLFPSDFHFSKYSLPSVALLVSVCFQESCIFSRALLTNGVNYSIQSRKGQLPPSRFPQVISFPKRFFENALESLPSRDRYRFSLSHTRSCSCRIWYVCPLRRFGCLCRSCVDLVFVVSARRRIARCKGAVGCMMVDERERFGDRLLKVVDRSRREGESCDDSASFWQEISR